MRRIDQRQKLMEAHASDISMFYKIRRNQRGKLSMYIDHVNVDATTCNSNIIMNGWQYHFSKLAQKSDNPDYDDEYLRKIEKEVKIITEICEDRSTYKPVTDNELMKAIKSLNRNKAADYFGVTLKTVYMGEKPYVTI